MFKYPLAVTIDTNIFDAAKFNLGDASTLRILENYVRRGKIKVVLSDIVVRESKRHIAARVKEVCGIVNTARNSALKVYHDILKELDNFIYAQNCLIEKDTRIAEIISEAIKTNGDNT